MDHTVLVTRPYIAFSKDDQTGKFQPAVLVRDVSNVGIANFFLEMKQS